MSTTSADRLVLAAPNPYLLLRPEPMLLTIEAASDAYLQATLTNRADITGRGVFDALTDDHTRPEADGVRNLRASIGRVLDLRVPDRMPVQRYDIQKADGAFVERWWSPLNLPVLRADGTVESILHYVEDVTEIVRASERSTALEVEGLRLARALAVANTDLRHANEALRDQADQKTLLLKEMNHRVKNTLAVVQAIAHQTASGSADLATFNPAFQARLSALGRAHDLLTRQSWGASPLGDAIRAAIAASIGAERVHLEMDDAAQRAMLPPEAVLALSLALHELATNAFKYGALSVPAGSITLRCRYDPIRDATAIDWQERGGPPILAAPTRRGFGRRLLERNLSSSGGLKVDLHFERPGLSAELRFTSSATTLRRL